MIYGSYKKDIRVIITKFHVIWLDQTKVFDMMVLDCSVFKSSTTLHSNMIALPAKSVPSEILMAQEAVLDVVTMYGVGDLTKLDHNIITLNPRLINPSGWRVSQGVRGHMWDEPDPLWRVLGLLKCEMYRVRWGSE